MGVMIAAAIATALALVLIGGAAWWSAPAADRRLLLLAGLVALPLQPLAFYLVRAPLVGAAQPHFGAESWWLLALIWAAPLTEEPAKWLVLLIPAVRRGLVPSNAIPLALAVGLGFGIGEIWFLSHAIDANPDMRKLPFWMFGGFMIERTEVCFLHGAFVAYLFVRLARGQSFWPGALAAILLHFAINFPIYLLQTNAFGLGRVTWTTVLIWWTVLAVIVGIVLMRFAHQKLKREGTLRAI